MTGTKTTSGFTMLWATEEMVNEHPISADTSAINDIESGAVCTIRARNPAFFEAVSRDSRRIEPGLRRKRHPILGLQFDQPNRVLRRQRVVFRHCHQKVLLGDQSRRDPERRYGPPHHPDVESSIEQHQQRLVRESGTVEHEFDTGIRLSHQFRPPPDEQMRRGPPRNPGERDLSFPCLPQTPRSRPSGTRPESRAPEAAALHRQQ